MLLFVLCRVIVEKKGSNYKFTTMPLLLYIRPLSSICEPNFQVFISSYHFVRQFQWQKGCQMRDVNCHLVLTVHWLATKFDLTVPGVNFSSLYLLLKSSFCWFYHATNIIMWPQTDLNFRFC